MRPPPDLPLIAVAAATAVALVLAGTRMLSARTHLAGRLDGLGATAAPEPAGEPAGGPAPEARAERLASLLLGSARERAEVERLLNRAGWRGAEPLLAFALGRLGAAVLAGASVLLLAPAGTALPFLALCAAALAFLAPKHALRLRAAEQARRIRRELPFTLDLLVMMLESGVGVDQAFRTLARGEDRAAPLTQAATALMVRDLDRGAPYGLALERWSERLAAPGARELARVIDRAMRHGSALGPALKEFAREFAELRVAQAREAVGRTAAKMTLAMLVLIMPALFIVLAGPAVGTLGKAIRTMSGAP